MGGITVHAQQISLYNQYRLNEFLINPSVAGYDGYTSFNVTAREQWIGLNNPPRTNTFSFQTRLLKRSFQINQKSVRKNILRKSRSGRVGIGGFIYNDNNGLIRRTGAQFSYAYHVHLGSNQLSFGLAGFVYQFNVDVDQIKLRDETAEELAFIRKFETTYIPDVGAGVSFTTNQYMLGFSATHLLASRLKIDQSETNKYAERYFYTFGKYRHPLSDNWAMEPMMLVKASEKFQIQGDISNTFIYNGDYWFGIGYRTKNSVMALLGFKYDRVYFGYSFDYTFSELTTRSLGSHEFSVALKLGDSARRYRWLERY
ncbi:MAG: type IX secretion system membrane protein PorP/SprF [Bacteroidetes bacterium]|jgi:type IX secretion system PorP/SprF family membrane protein|nr:type IX secretion system membrane protein PorP/SprF [Bacteroidota bacterium]